MTDFPRKLRMLLLAIDPPYRNADTVVDHRRSFRRYSRHEVAELSDVGVPLPKLSPALDLDRFDVLVLHYSNYLLADGGFSGAAKERIKAFRGLKVLFVQDEYRLVSSLRHAIRNLGIDLLFTCIPEAEVPKVYPAAELPGVSICTTLTGYVSERLLAVRSPPIAARPVDVGYRGRKVPYWLGALGAEKWQIVDRFSEAAALSGLACDLSHAESDRLYGPKWLRFLLSCKATLGVESGASVFDFDGSIQRDVEAYLAARPGASFEEVQARFLQAHEGSIVHNQISPRCFEAAALRTCMVLHEGDYSGILFPWRHYVPLKKDFSNFPVVLDVLRDSARLQVIADCAYEEVARDPRYSYRSFIGDFDDRVEREIVARRTRLASRPAGRVALLPFQLRSNARLAAHRIRHAIPSSLKRRIRSIIRRGRADGTQGS